MLLLIIVAGVCSLLLLGLILIIVSTVMRKGIWGINLGKVVCPKCGEDIPTMRTPGNLRQALWGGSTCKKCGCEVDKWGIEIHP